MIGASKRPPGLRRAIQTRCCIPGLPKRMSVHAITASPRSETATTALSAECLQSPPGAAATTTGALQ
jgi:hypothetical protein